MKGSNLVEVWPLGVVESDPDSWPLMGHAPDSPLAELYPNPFDRNSVFHRNGDVVRWGQVRLVDGIAYRQMSFVLKANGLADGMLAVYGKVSGDCFKKGHWDAVSVELLSFCHQECAIELVQSDYAEFLQEHGLSQANARKASQSVIMLTDTGWVQAA
jgi:hypothetical protein